MSGLIKEVAYLGDAVYALYDGEFIILRTERHNNIESSIYLDVDVFGQLLKFAARVKEPKSYGERGGSGTDE